MKGFLAILAALAFTLPAAAKVKTEVVEYKQGDVVLQGYLSYDEPQKEEFWLKVKNMVPWAKRVDNVKGSDAAHNQTVITDNPLDVTNPPIG